MFKKQETLAIFKQNILYRLYYGLQTLYLQQKISAFYFQDEY
jgi:hypothetical protein